jgi:streptomycin 6-kinase
MFAIPDGLAWLQKSVDGPDWLRELPGRVAECQAKWGLQLDAPYEKSYVSIVFPATLADGSPVVLKIQLPHDESEHEQDALRLWNGSAAVQLLDYEPAHHALLLERCDPGAPLSSVASDEALEVLGTLLPRLWVPAGAPFRSLADEASRWIADLPTIWERAGRPCEESLVRLAMASLERLGMTQGEQVLIHQDLHTDNVLSARREPWLVIDPKPLVGEREFSLAPIIRNAELGFSRDHVVNRLNRLTARLGLDRERARLWALGQTVAWCEGDFTRQHIATARWLAEA